ncbi:MAG: hypothetical protein ACJAWV_001417 [Flammeovirgaceae bacterium]|jgi:hypothetical protein
MTENQDVTLQQLMANKNAQEIFQQSKYKERELNKCAFSLVSFWTTLR